MEVNVLNDALNIAEAVPNDESIESYEFREYESQNPAALNNIGEIQIDIQNQDIFVQPSRIYLLVEGRLASANATAYTTASLVSLINNAVPFLFKQIVYEMNNTPIKRVQNLGQVTTMKDMLTYGDD